MEVIEYLGTPVQVADLYARFRTYSLVVDSRLVSYPCSTVFFALVGQRQDGHDFITDLYANGIRAFVVRPGFTLSDSDASTLVVHCAQPIVLLQQLAAHHRRQFPNLQVVAITGSNGKTIVKDWLAQLLAYEYSVGKSPRSYNSQIGVPLSVWQLRPEHQFAIIEVGISRPGEMKVLQDIVKPNRVLLTTIGTAHLSNFPSLTDLVVEKLMLAREASELTTPQEVVDRFGALLPKKPRLRIIGSPVTEDNGEAPDGQITLPVATHLEGIYQENARLTIAAAYYCGLSLASLNEHVAELKPLTNRLEQREGRDGGPVINDSYSNDFTALAAALQFARTQDPFGSITLILGVIQPLPDLTERLTALLTGSVDRLFLIGPASYLLTDAFPWANYYGSVEQALPDLVQLDYHRQTVLIKGASYQHFDRIADALSRQLHRTTLTIDLTALRHNLGVYRDQLPPATKLLVMAKASAYGSGALPVAKVLQDAGADYLAVAYPEEGRELRRGGIELPIMVLNAEPYSLSTLAADRLEPVIHSLKQYETADRLGLPMHLEVDTGMGRLGFSPAEFAQQLPQLTSSNVQSLFTHLAASDDPAHDAFTRLQIARFEEVRQAYRAGGGARVQCHVLNSEGITRFPAAAYDMVRLGIGLYGVGVGTADRHLLPALSLTATISSITERAQGQTVGYGRRGLLTRDSRVAVISIGYADGLPRAVGEGRVCFSVKGQPAPTVGSVCMDMCMIDITDVVSASVGDTVIIFHDDESLSAIAEAAGTIPYEILTGVGPRVHRIYRGE